MNKYFHCHLNPSLEIHCKQSSFIFKQLPRISLSFCAEGTLFLKLLKLNFKKSQFHAPVNTTQRPRELSLALLTVTRTSKSQSLSHERKMNPELHDVIVARKSWPITCQVFQFLTAGTKLLWLCLNLDGSGATSWLLLALCWSNLSAVLKQIKTFSKMKYFIGLHLWCTFPHTMHLRLLYSLNSDFGLCTIKVMHPKSWQVILPSFEFTTELRSTYQLLLPCL